MTSRRPQTFHRLVLSGRRRTAVMPGDLPGLSAEVNRQWHGFAQAEQLFDERGTFLVDVQPGEAGVVSGRWVRVRLTEHWDLAGMLGTRPARPDLATSSTDGTPGSGSPAAHSTAGAGQQHVGSRAAQEKPTDPWQSLLDGLTVMVAAHGVGERARLPSGRDSRPTRRSPRPVGPCSRPPRLAHGRRGGPGPPKSRGARGTRRVPGSADPDQWVRLTGSGAGRAAPVDAHLGSLQHAARSTARRGVRRTRRRPFRTHPGGSRRTHRPVRHLAHRPGRRPRTRRTPRGLHPGVAPPGHGGPHRPAGRPRVGVRARALLRHHRDHPMPLPVFQRERSGADAAATCRLRTDARRASCGRW